MEQRQLDDLKEGDQDTFEEEKMNDVDEIINGDSEKNKDKKIDSDKKANEPEKETKKETKIESKNESPSEKSNPSEPQQEIKKEEDWNWDEEDKQGIFQGKSTWKYVSGILFILLIVAVYTHGFNFNDDGVASALTIADAETKAIDYFNNNLLQPPFEAELVSSEELTSFFKVTLSVAGQEVESYVDKTGKFFFPQGYDLEKPLTEEAIPSEEELVEVSIDDDPVKGDPDAPVTIIEFSEFQCPFCKRYVDQTYPQILKDYIETGKVKYVFRDFPLGFHPHAKPAAMASECAHEQDKFWEYHDELFENNENLGDDLYLQIAADLGLDIEQFQTCLESEKYSEEVDKDLADGQKYGISGTPGFFINGKLISGAQPYSVFKDAIEQALNGPTQPEETDPIAPEIETQPVEPQPTVETKQLQLSAKKWRFSPRELEINQGDLIKLTLSSDFDFQFNLPDFNLEEEVFAGETKTVEFTASKKGTFEFSCGTYCIEVYGDKGALLKGELIVN